MGGDQAIAGGFGAVIVLESHFRGWAPPWRALTAVDRNRLQRAAIRGPEPVRWIEVETSRDRDLARRFALEVVPAVLVLVGDLVQARLHGRSTGRDVERALRSAIARRAEICSLVGSSGTGGPSRSEPAFATLAAP